MWKNELWTKPTRWIITGVIIDIDKDWVTVHAGLKSEGVISIDQFYNDKGEIEVVIGDVRGIRDFGTGGDAGETCEE